MVFPFVIISKVILGVGDYEMIQNDSRGTSKPISLAQLHFVYSPFCTSISPPFTPFLVLGWGKNFTQLKSNFEVGF